MGAEIEIIGQAEKGPHNAHVIGATYIFPCLDLACAFLKTSMRRIQPKSGVGPIEGVARVAAAVFQFKGLPQGGLGTRRTPNSAGNAAKNHLQLTKHVDLPISAAPP